MKFPEVMENDLLISKDGKHHHRGYRGKEYRIRIKDIAPTANI
ncbi:11517_t:CDS:1, partial [Funneliformis mosseae]